MKRILFVCSFFMLIIIHAQTSLPPNPKPGKSYVHCIFFTKQIKWREIDCNQKEIYNQKNKNKEKLFVMHFKMLDSLGYKVDLAKGLFTEKNILAHNKYIRDLEKEKRKLNGAKRKTMRIKNKK